jgi:hypothetical protein
VRKRRAKRVRRNERFGWALRAVRSRFDIDIMLRKPVFSNWQ